MMRLKQTAPPCPRCGGDHGKKIKMKKLKRPIVLGLDTATHWTLCPKTKEPILGRRL